MNNKSLTREELLSSQFSMLQEIHKTCTEHNLRYYLAYGTLIGAVRHKGFIPWDDDLDIMMPVEDYNKFRELYNSERYFVTDCFHDKRHQLYFPRFYDGNTCIGGDNKSLGVFVDIYLMHGAPTTQKECAFHALRAMRMNERRKQLIKWRGRIARHFLPFLWNQHESFIISNCCRQIYKKLSYYKIERSNVVYAFGGDGLTELFWKEYFDKTTMLSFNGSQFCVPNKYHEVLSVTYGDYMKLPPEEKRHPYHGSSSFCWKSNV